jgi:hypothetical protein
MVGMQQVPQAFVVTLAEKPTPQTTLGDVLLGSLGITGILVLLALVLGVLLALVLVRWHRRHPPELDHLPSVSPLIPSTKTETSSPIQ